MSRLQRIIVAEADADVRDLLYMALGAVPGLAVSVLASGEAAIGACARRRPDLVLLDAELEDVPGEAAAARLRTACDGAAPLIVFMTASVDRDRHARLAGEGVAGVLVKPFDPLTLAGRLRGLWRDAHAVAA